MSLILAKQKAEEELSHRLALIGQATAILSRRGFNPETENSLQLCTIEVLKEHHLVKHQYKIASAMIEDANNLRDMYPEDQQAKQLVPWLTNLRTEARVAASNASNDLEILRQLCEHKPDVFNSKCEICGRSIK